MKEYHITTFDIQSLPRFAVGFDRIFEELVRTQEKLKDNYPPYNILRTSELTYDFEVAVAGFEEDELTVEVQNGELIIKGTKREEMATDVGNYLHRGIAGRNFTRVFALGDNTEVLNATVRNGILTVSVEVYMPQLEQPKKIAISFQK